MTTLRFNKNALIDYEEKMQEMLAKATEVVLNVEPEFWECALINGVEDDESNPAIPGYINGRWRVSIEIQTGIVKNWPAGIVADIRYMVCNQGFYILRSDTHGTIFTMYGYVPKFLSIAGNCDLIILKINGNGKIEKWNPIDCLDSFLDIEVYCD